LSFELLSGFHLRRVSDFDDVRSWIDPVPGLSLVAVASILVVLFSGMFLTVRMSAFDAAWLKVTIGALLLIAPLGAMTAKLMRVIRSRSADLTPGLLRGLNDPFLKISLGIRIAVFFWDSVRHDRQTGIAAIDRRLSVLCNCQSLIGIAGLAQEGNATHS